MASNPQPETGTVLSAEDVAALAFNAERDLARCDNSPHTDDTAYCGKCGWTPALRKVCAQLAAAQAERDTWKKEAKLATHKVITCGVAASHPNPDLTRTGAYAEKWDSPQAETVRTMRAKFTESEATVAQLRDQLKSVREAARREAFDDAIATAGQFNIPGHSVVGPTIDGLIANLQRQRDAPPDHP